MKSLKGGAYTMWAVLAFAHKVGNRIWTVKDARAALPHLSAPTIRNACQRLARERRIHRVYAAPRKYAVGFVADAIWERMSIRQ